jgi:hypothetical protein
MIRYTNTSIDLPLKCICHDLCNLLFVIIGIFYEEMQYIFKRKYSIFTGLSGLKVTGYDIRELQIRFLLFLAYKIPDLMSYPVTLRADNPMKMAYFLIKIYCISS